jgi:hypothetical protein
MFVKKAISKIEKNKCVLCLSEDMIDILGQKDTSLNSQRERDTPKSRDDTKRSC